MKVAGGGGWWWGRGCPHLQNNFKTSATLAHTQMLTHREQAPAFKGPDAF